MSRETSIHAGRAGSYRFGRQPIARMGFGAMQLRRLADTPADAVALLRRSIELGVDHFDTAQFYGDDGFVNRVIAEVVRDASQVVVVTKVGADPDPGGKIPIRPAQRPEQLRASVEDNLRSLGVEQLAVVNLRRLDVGPGLTAEGDQIVDIDDQLAAMVAMRDEGKIGAIGLSAVSMESLKRAIPAGIVCVQNAYSLVSRQDEDMLAICAGHEIAWVPFFPLGGAFPGHPKVAGHATVTAIAARLAVKPSQLGLAWLLAHRPEIVLIPGTASAAHLDENIAAASIALDVETIAELDKVHKLPPKPDHS
jgi:pyridoxine 4-dehydrogenase